jgi:Domain of unknown function (DUF892)
MVSVARLREVFQFIEKKPQGKTCDAIVGITEEGAEIIKEYKGTPALDAGLLAAAQAPPTWRRRKTSRRNGNAADALQSSSQPSSARALRITSCAFA